MSKKAYVKIQSSITINVTPGLSHKDLTKKKSDVADRLKISATWPKATVLIKAGQHWYPSHIADWAAVKALEKKGQLTIGAYSDVPGEEPVITKENLDKNLKEIGQDIDNLSESELDKLLNEEK